MKKEPVVTIGGITAIIVAALAVLTSFGVLSLDAAQQKAVVGIIGAVAPIVAALIARRHVTPVPKAAPDATQAGAVDAAFVCIVATLVLVILIFCGVHLHLH